MGGVGISGSINISGNLMTSAGFIKSNSGIASTSTTTGALIATGGLGVSGAANIGGTTKIIDITDSTLTTDGALIVNGGVGIGENTNIGGVLKVFNTASSTSTDGGAFVVTGGVGIGENLHVGGNLDVNGSIDIAGITKLTNNTSSTLTTNGALVITGGVGIGENLNVGGSTDLNGSVDIIGITKITNNTASTLTNNGALIVTGGAGIGGAINTGGAIKSFATTASTSTITGALISAGGLGVSGAVNSGGAIKSFATTASTSTITGALISAGGLGVSGATYIGGTGNIAGITTVSNNTASTLTNNGALIVTGGAGIGDAINAGGAIKSFATTASTSTLTGALISAGGLGVSGATYIGGTGNIAGITTVSNNTASTTTASGAFVVTGGAGIGENVNIGGTLNVIGASTFTELTKHNNGILDMGNLAVMGDGEFSNNVNIGGLTSSTTTTSGALIVSGGTGIAGKLNIGGDTKTMGSLTVDGGLSVGAGINAGGGGVFGGAIQTTGTIDAADRIKVNTATKSTNTTTGSIITLGGIGVADTIHTGIPIGTDSGGTGLADAYATGDILVAKNSNTLYNLPVGNPGKYLIADPTASAGVLWSYGILQNFIHVSEPIYISETQFMINHAQVINNPRTQLMSITAPVIISTSTTGMNGILVNNGSSLAGTIYYDNITGVVTGTGTTFITDFVPGDTISLDNNGQKRKIVNITSNTSMTISPSFSGPLNEWIRNGTGTMSTVQFKFGTSSYRAANAGDYLGLNIGTLNGNTTPTNWTIEFWVYITTATATAVCYSIGSPFAFRIGYTGTRFNISLGNNGSYNLRNATNFTGFTSTNTWAHIAVSFNGSTYRCFLNGSLTNGVTFNSTAVLPPATFDSFTFASDGTTTIPCYIDEIRISNIARYTAAFTVSASAFTVDANCIALNHLNGVVGTFDFPLYDDTISNKSLTYNRGGLAPLTHYYIYLISDGSTTGIILSTRCESLAETIIDLPVGYTTNNIRQTQYNISTDINGNISRLSWSGLSANIQGLPLNATITSNTMTNISLSDYIPKTAVFVTLVCNLTNKDTSNSVVIGPNALIGYSIICNTTANGNAIQTYNTALGAYQTLDVRIVFNTLGSSVAIHADKYSVVMPY